VLFKKGAQRELVDVNELIQEMIVLPRAEAALPLQTAAPRRLTQFFCGIAGLFTSESRLGLRGSSRRLLYTENRSLTLAYWVVLIAGMAVAQDNSSQHPSARQQLQHIHGPQSIDQELARLTKDLKLTPEQQKQVRPLLQEHHDRIQALLDKNPTASRQEFASQIHSISDETHHKIRALLTDHQKELEKAMQQREHNGQENRRPAPPAAASPEPPSSVRQN
jgi:Spy/CpxP family protein refolding chaperone